MTAVLGSSAETALLDWARVYDYQLRDDDALAARLRIWTETQTRLGRRVVRQRFGAPEFIFGRNGEMDDITNQSGPPPGYVYRAFAVAAIPAVVHTYKGEGLTACGLEVVGPCPDCERAT